jgi:hypothetical protein
MESNVKGLAHTGRLQAQLGEQLDGKSPAVWIRSDRQSGDASGDHGKNQRRSRDRRQFDPRRPWEVIEAIR